MENASKNMTMREYAARSNIDFSTRLNKVDTSNLGVLAIVLHIIYIVETVRMLDMKWLSPEVGDHIRSKFWPIRSILSKLKANHHCHYMNPPMLKSHYKAHSSNG